MFVIPEDLHPALVPLAFLLGTWRGEGIVEYPTMDGQVSYGQEIVFRTNGKPYLIYTSRTWNPVNEAPMALESGYWRPQPDNEVEVVLAHPSGIVEVYYGKITGQRVDLGTDLVGRTPTAKEVTGNRRLYGVVDGGDLAYAVDMAAMGLPLTPHLAAKLSKVADA